MVLDVLFEDNHLLCVAKPPMLPVQADASGDPDLLTIAKSYVKEKYGKLGDVYLGLVHRLDRPVGGAIAFARTSKAAARLQASMRAGAWEKRYLAVVSGRTPESGALENYLWKDEATRTSYAVAADKPGAKFARLRYKALAYADEMTLLEIALESGRHHQIRVQLSHAGWPIWGDARYNPDSAPGQAIALFAAALSFPHPTKGSRVLLLVRPPDAQAWKRFRESIATWRESAIGNLDP